MTIRAVRVESATLVTLQAFLKPGGFLFWFQGAGRELEPDLLVFPLVFSRVVPLVEASGSRLVILNKQSPCQIATVFHVEHCPTREVRSCVFHVEHWQV